jgi:hypothetical protein
MLYADYAERISQLEAKLHGFLPQAEREKIAQQIRRLEAQAEKDGLE